MLGCLKMEGYRESAISRRMVSVSGRQCFLRIVFYVSVRGSFPGYFLHFGAKIFDLFPICCISDLKSLICMPTWLSSFGFWFLSGFCWLLAFGRWFHLAFGFCWVVKMQFTYYMSENTPHFNYIDIAQKLRTNVFEILCMLL